MVFKGKDLQGYILDFDKNRNLVSVELPAISDVNNADTMIFTPNEDILKWTQEHIRICTSKDFTGTQFEYSFLPSGIVEIQTVKCTVCNKEHIVYLD